MMLERGMVVPHISRTRVESLPWLYPCGVWMFSPWGGVWMFSPWGLFWVLQSPPPPQTKNMQRCGLSCDSVAPSPISSLTIVASGTGSGLKTLSFKAAYN